MSGSSTISVENFTSFAVWVFDGEKEYAIPFSEFPCRGNSSVDQLMHPTLSQGFHLCGESLDIDIDLRSLDHLEDFPFYFESPQSAAHSNVSEEATDYHMKKDSK